MKNNQELQTDVENAIRWEPLLQAAEIGVIAKEGIVSLSGNVNSYSKKVEAENAAKKVIGVKENSKDLAIDYRQMAIEDIDFEPKEFDVVISSLAFHYLKDLKTIFGKINQTFKKGGSFVFSMEHPVFTSRAEQDWFIDEDGNRLHWPIDNYHDESKRKAQFLGHEVTKYHRTLQTIINTAIRSNFDIQEISEPKPSEEILKKYTEMKDEMRRPIFIIISAIKK